MFKRLKKAVQWVFDINALEKDIDDARSHLQGAKANFRSRLDNLRRDRDVPQEALAEDFQRVLIAWGMQEGDIPHVINTMYLRVAVMLVPGVLGCIVLWQGYGVIAMLSAVPLFLVSVMGVLTTLWRISILRHRQFYPFNSTLTRFMAAFAKR